MYFPRLSVMLASIPTGLQADVQADGLFNDLIVAPGLSACPGQGCSCSYSRAVSGAGGSCGWCHPDVLHSIAGSCAPALSAYSAFLCICTVSHEGEICEPLLGAPLGMLVAARVQQLCGWPHGDQENYARRRRRQEHGGSEGRLNLRLFSLFSFPQSVLTASSKPCAASSSSSLSWVHNGATGSRIVDALFF